MSVRSYRAVRLGVSAALMTSFSANAHVRTASRAKPTLRLSGKYWPAIVSLAPYLSLIWPAKMGLDLQPSTTDLAHRPHFCTLSLWQGSVKSYLANLWSSGQPSNESNYNKGASSYLKRAKSPLRHVLWVGRLPLESSGLCSP